MSCVSRELRLLRLVPQVVWNIIGLRWEEAKALICDYGCSVRDTVALLTVGDVAATD